MAKNTAEKMPESIWAAYRSNVLELARLRGFEIYGCNGCQTMFPDYDSFWAHGYAHKIKSVLDGSGRGGSTI